MTNKEIIQKLGLESMPVEVQEQTLEQVTQIVELRVMGLIGEMMTKDQQEVFEERAKQGPETVMQWLSSEFADVAKIYISTLKDYLDEVTARQN
ncbi:hypothetical protein KDA08_05360 [Candidatus Saccharibacteria bacterium]|jgi:hypothetical protein|nr:hypothetical protein [Candidatus Saccharibacteria bacterium]